MQDVVISDTQRRILVLCSAFAGLAIPLSTAAQNIGTGLLLLCFLGMSPLRRELPRVLREPFPIACLVLYAWLLIGTLWSSAPWADRLEMLERMREYLLAPVFLCAMRERAARSALVAAFAAGVCISVLASIGLAAGHIKFMNTWPEDNNWPVFRSHTYHDLFIAWTLTGLLAGLMYGYVRRSTHRWLAWGALAVCLLDAYLLVRGRTAQVLMLCMFAMLALRQNFRAAILPILVAAIVVPATLYMASAQVRTSVALIERNLSDYEAGKLNGNSVGLRFEFWRNTARLVSTAPVLGHGTGSFRSEYAALTGFTKEQHFDRASHNPHNDYLWLWMETGPLGALSLVAVIAAFVLQARRMPEAQRFTMEAIAFSMAIGTLANSFFTDNVSGVGFMVIASALLGGALWRREESTA